MTDATQNDAPKTLQDHLKALGGAALIVAFPILMLELLLTLTDPWGMRYFNDLARLGNEVFIGDDARGYVMPDGEHPFSHWSATIADEARIIPQTNADASCTIAVLGDSVAFGYGVDDGDVWLNQLAPTFADVRFINWGVPRYNSTNVLRTFQASPDADAYLYLVVNNDVDPAIDPTTQEFAGSGEGYPWLIRYVNYAIFRGGGTAYVAPDDPNRLLRDTSNTQRFFNEVDALLDEGDGRVYLASFEFEPITNTLLDRDYDVTVLSYPPDRISFSDYHLNQTGNGTLGEQLTPLFREMQAAHCNA